jgi:aminopeptidase N
MNEAYCRRADAASSTIAERRPFALPAAKPKYAPDRPARVEHIALVLSFDFEKKILHGRCSTTFTAVATKLAEIEMDAAQLTILKASTPTGKRLKFDHTGSKLRISLEAPLAAGKSAKIVVDYEARQPRQGIYFIGPDEAYPNKPLHVWTQGQDEDAHYWFPCIDYPNAKATTEVTATVPAAFFVLSNGSCVKTTTDARKKTKTYHWKMEVPHVTYLVSCVAGKFSGHTDVVDGVPVSYYVHPGREADGARSFGKTPKMVRFFGDRLKYKYPYPKYAQIAVSDFIFGGMENTTATTQTDTTLHDARAHLDFSSDPLVAHELAHQWFGDLLTCKDWSHAWLNEGFATYFEALFREFDQGEDEFQYYRIELQDTYKREDSHHYRRSIVTNVYVEPVDLFDRHLYEKGACVLHMIRAQLGDALWWTVMQRYVRDNAERNVETVDFARAIEEATGKNFAPFFDQWVMHAGHPEFDVSYRWEAERSEAVVVVAQTQVADDQTQLFKVPVDFEFGFPGGVRQHVQVVCDAARQSFYVPLRSKPETFVFDPAGDVLKTLTLHVPSDMLLRQLARHPLVAARVEAARALARDGDAEAVDGLAKALQKDTFWGVAAEAAKALSRIRGERAFDVLAAATNVAHPKARRAVADALGEFRTEAAYKALAPLARKDASYHVEAAAAAAVGKTRATSAFDTLRASLAKESWNEVIRCGALAGLAELGDERAIPICLEWTHYGRPTFARRSAIASLGKLGEGRKDVRDAVIALLDDKQFQVRMSAVAALEALHDAAALPALDAMAQQDLDGRLKRRCAEAARAIREHAQRPAEVKKMRDDLEELRAANRTLLDRVDRLEAIAKKKASKRL